MIHSCIHRDLTFQTVIHQYQMILHAQTKFRLCMLVYLSFCLLAKAITPVRRLIGVLALLKPLYLPRGEPKDVSTTARLCIYVAHIVMSTSRQL